MSGIVHRFADWLRVRFSDAERYFILCAIAGVLCGLAAVSFHVAIEAVFGTVLRVQRMIGGPGALVFLACAPALGGLLAGLILTFFAPNASGSGIPQVKRAFYNDFGRIRFSEGVWRFIAGTLSVGSGNSLGREGPTVHMSCAIASSLGQVFGLARRRVQAMVPVGMGAGIAAAFNAPLAAITFVFEELLDDFSSKALGAILVAVVIAAVVERSILGEHPIFDMSGVGPFTTEPWMLLSIPIGVAAAFGGFAFHTLLLGFRARFLNRWKLPVYVQTTIGGLGVGLIGVVVFSLTDRLGVFSIGYHDLDAALHGLLDWRFLLLLFVGKLIATAFCYGAGGSGGIFAPTLFMGAMLGGIFGVFAVEVLGQAPATTAGCALLGMGAFFAAVIRCPLTSILIIFEMTQNYSLILPLMAGNLIAYAIAGRLARVPIYDALLLQDRVNLRKMPTFRGEKDWQNLPVGAIMAHDPVVVPASLTAAAARGSLAGQVHHGYPVVAENGDLVGMVMDHELHEFERDFPERTVGDLIAGQKVVAVYPADSIRSVANTLVARDVLQVPVVSARDPARLVGIVTLHDIARQQNALSESIERD